MKNSALYYGVGPLLYSPATNESIANLIINNKLDNPFSLAICLEDTINDNYILEAEDKLVETLKTIFDELEKKEFYLPKIFIRVRNPQQIIKLQKKLGTLMSIITGFILPKFSLDNADLYIKFIIEVNEKSNHPIYAMPIYESSTLIDLRTRYEILYSLKNKLDAIENLVLNIRVGGNDLCHIFGFRRNSNESIHKIRPISNLFADIITVYGINYVISGPVWEYYNGSNWEEGLINEISDDILCGFTGKTVIHPKQIKIVNNSYKVNINDLESAKSILNWNLNSHSLVCGDMAKERMNEYKTHTNWAQRIIFMAQAYGIK